MSNFRIKHVCDPAKIINLAATERGRHALVSSVVIMMNNALERADDMRFVVECHESGVEVASAKRKIRLADTRLAGWDYASPVGQETRLDYQWHVTATYWDTLDSDEEHFDVYLNTGSDAQLFWFVPRTDKITWPAEALSHPENPSAGMWNAPVTLVDCSSTWAAKHATKIVLGPGSMLVMSSRSLRMRGSCSNTHCTMFFRSTISTKEGGLPGQLDVDEVREECQEVHDMWAV